MSQLSVFDIPPQTTIADLPIAIIPLRMQAEEAIAEIEEPVDIEPRVNSALVQGCAVRSDLFFKGRTGKVIGFEKFSTITLAIVQMEFNGSTIKFPCGMSALQVVQSA